MMTKVTMRRVLWRLLKLFGIPIPTQDFAKSAIVFSPHPDDETLGCGGTIVRKKRVGAAVKVVYMTDGSLSHRRFLSANELRKMRRREALAATQVLGVGSEDVIFLDFEDHRLGDRKIEAAEAVAEILTTGFYDEVFVPCARDGIPDHVATNEIVVKAVKELAREIVIYEYPIWFWRHWPWTSFVLDSRSDILREIVTAICSWIVLLRDFHWLVPIDDVLALKREALAQHCSQMTRVIPDVNWPILADVSRGEFIECFFRDHEIFARRRDPETR
jgi:LmbE family N-acetylglucosaminyl deacetylase